MQTHTVLPSPQVCIDHRGEIALESDGLGRGGLFVPPTADGKVGRARQWIDEASQRLTGRPLTPCHTPEACSLALGTVEGLVNAFGPEVVRRTERLASKVQKEQGYCIWTDEGRTHLSAPSSQGVLYAAASFCQLLRTDQGKLTVPRVEIDDWPDIRYRAVDWLLNCEINRWSYDWGDGLDAYRDRVKHKLDWCARHKINMVYFDGCGWGLDRFEGYATLMRELNGFARERGIRLVFVGYGGGYGITYQTSELYQAPYFGHVHLNRRAHPDGDVYECIGPGSSYTRTTGTCLSNEALAEQKLAELKRFVEAVEPGAMYIHDIDAGGYDEANACWQTRCDECRRRWPNDTYETPDGAAGAYATWFRRVAQCLSEVSNPTTRYQAATDCTLVFTGPLYSSFQERNADSVWPREADYFTTVSQLLGPAPNVQFGLREQFLHPDGQARVQQLADALRTQGEGHGVQIIAFGGGDMYTSDSLLNVSGVFSRYYRGAEAVCTSNGGVHEDAVSLLNAEFLWNMGSPRYSLPDLSPAEVRAQFIDVRKMGAAVPGLHDESGLLPKLFTRQYGSDAGAEMWEACRSELVVGIPPVSRVWWAVTRDISALQGGLDAEAAEARVEHWQLRRQATGRALTHAQAALDMAGLEADVRKDITWFLRSLEVGAQFAEVMALTFELQSSPTDAEPHRQVALAALASLETALDEAQCSDQVDPLGGDVGAWAESVKRLGGLLRHDWPPH